MHTLFGGNDTAEQQHVCYEVRLMDLNQTYACKFDALDQPVICNDIPAVPPGVWTNELLKEGIELSDTRGCQPISLLIGADIAGKILTRKIFALSCGLTAVETLLGWVLMGKVPKEKKTRSTTMVVTNLLNGKAYIAKLWELDVLGITDTGKKRSKEDLQRAAKQMFEETIETTAESRYEVRLPCLEGHPALPSNRAMAVKRLESTENRLRKSDRWEKYD